MGKKEELAKKFEKKKPVGRPRKPKEVSRTSRVSCNFTMKEYKMLVKQASARNEDAGTYARKIVGLHLRKNAKKKETK